MPGPTPPRLLPLPADAGRAPLLVGYSGGLDSTLLLHLLAGDARLRSRGLRAIHVHHGLHPRADAWALHCEDECATLGMPFEVVRVEVSDDAGEGLEAAARRARHAAFESALREGEVLVLAHHRDDQAETFLLRALRGSGADGLAAMRPWRAFGRGWLWRPLLVTPREALLEHARTLALRWIDDPSNDDDAHDRNFLRQRVLPLLRSRWPQADASFARSAALLGETNGLLDREDAAALASVRGIDPACIDAGKLADLPAPRRARVLRRWIARAGLPPLPAEGVARIERDLLGEHTGEASEFGWRDAVVRRWRELLWAEWRRPPLPATFRADWHGDRPLPLPNGGQLRFSGTNEAMSRVDDATPPYVVHARAGGERIALPGRAHTHALKHVLQDLGVPPWLRARMPLLSSRDGALLAAGDLLYSATFEARLAQAGQRLVWSPPGT